MSIYDTQEHNYYGITTSSYISLGNNAISLQSSPNMTFFDWRNQIEENINSILDIYNKKVIVKCKHCGQWVAVMTSCKYCGAPVDLE